MILRLGGQIRVAATGHALGWDMGSALALGAAMGVDTRAAAEFLPAVEPIMAREHNKAIREASE